MGKVASDATKLRAATSEVNKLEKEIATLRRSLREFQTKASTQELELAEWRNRFDRLLARMPLSGKAEVTAPSDGLGFRFVESEVSK